MSLVGTAALAKFWSVCKNTFQPKGDYLTSVPSEYVTDTELTNKNYATKDEIPDAVAEMTEAEVDEICV